MSIKSTFTYNYQRLQHLWSWRRRWHLRSSCCFWRKEKLKTVSVTVCGRSVGSQTTQECQWSDPATYVLLQTLWTLQWNGRLISTGKCTNTSATANILIVCIFFLFLFSFLKLRYDFVLEYIHSSCRYFFRSCFLNSFPFKWISDIQQIPMT